MQKLTHTFILLMISVMIPTQSMENDYKEQALIAEEYNQNNPNINFIENILTLPHEVLNQIFCFDQVEEKKPYIKYILNDTPIYGDPLPDQTTPIEKKIKCCMRLKTVCKHLNTFLTGEKIGYLCQNYNQKSKDSILQRLANIYQTNYYYVRLPELILVCAGANPNVNNCRMPLLFFVRTKAIAQLFIKHKANVHATYVHHSGGERNILWQTLDKEYPAELMELYLSHNVDATLYVHGNSLLHKINQIFVEPQYAGNALKKAEHLLNAIPHMINAPNCNKKTPLDLAQALLHMKFTKFERDENHEYIYYTNPEVTQAGEKLVALFREHGALTAQEIAEQAESSK